MKTYYDNISNQQNRELKVGVTMIYRLLAQTLGIKVPDGYGIKFRSLWLLNDTEKASIAQSITSAVSAGVDLGVSQQTALKELRASAQVTGLWNNITDEDIEDAQGMVPPMAEEVAMIKSEGEEESAAEKAGEGSVEGGPEGNLKGATSSI